MNMTPAVDAMDKPTLADTAGGSETPAVDSEYVPRGGIAAGSDFDVVALVTGGATNTAARLLPATFLSCELISPNAAVCEPGTR